MTIITLYAITDARPKIAGLHSSKLGKAWIVFGRSRTKKAEPTPTSLRAYDRVVRRIARVVPALLPFRFGSLVRDEDELASLLLPLAASITTALARTRGCVQFTMRVHGERKKRSVKKRASGGPGTRWLARRREALRVPEIDPVIEETKELSREVRYERQELRRKKEEGTSPPHLATVYHLVPKECARAFRAAVGEAEKKLDGVSIKTTGPWPPYAFAELP